MTNSKTGALVLCGGRSQRMGQPKYLLPFGDQCLLQRVVDVVASVCDFVGVVAAADQEMPELPASVEVFRDEQPNLGPLSGIASGLTQLSSRADGADRVFVSSCDAPFLNGEYIRGLLTEIGDHDMAIVRGKKHFHPMGAVYSTRIAPIVRQLVADEQLRPIFLLDKCDAKVVEAESMRRYDPELKSLQNMNTPDDYRAALKVAGLPLPDQPE